MTRFCRTVSLLAALSVPSCVPNPPKKSETIEETAPSAAGTSRLEAEASSASDAFEEELFVEFYDSVIAQQKHDIAQIVSMLRDGVFTDRGAARKALMEATLPQGKLRQEFVGAKANALHKPLGDVMLLEIQCRSFAEKHPAVEAREAKRKSQALEPDLERVFSALRAKWPEDSGDGSAVFERVDSDASSKKDGSAKR